MTASRLLSLPLLALAPLMLAACDDAATADGAASGEPLPAIAAPAGTQWADTVAVTPEGGYRIGNPDAPLKLVEYASHTCGHCADFSKTGKQPLKDKYDTHFNKDYLKGCKILSMSVGQARQRGAMMVLYSVRHRNFPDAIFKVTKHHFMVTEERPMPFKDEVHPTTLTQPVALPHMSPMCSATTNMKAWVRGSSTN